MTDAAWVAFHQWALPRLGLHWRGFRRVRRQVEKRIAARIAELGLADAAAYRQRLEQDRAEWQALARLCTVSISRFFRDREVFERLGDAVLPELARAVGGRGAEELDCWSAGCASGEEPYTVAIQWSLELAARFPRLRLRVLGTDVDPVLLERARDACYKASSLRELPPGWQAQAFERRGALFCLRERFRRDVEFETSDLAAEVPGHMFDLILCRNLAFTYFGPELAQRVLERLATRLHPGGALVIGIHERLPQTVRAFEPWPGCRAAFRLRAAA